MAKLDGVFDVVVIGSGPGGYVAAIRAGQLGLRTAIVEKDGKYGGTCLHVGCIPTKVLLHDAYFFDQVKDARRFGVEIADYKLNFEKVMSHKDIVVKKLAIGVEGLLKKNRVTTVVGFGRIKHPRLVEVTAADGAKTEIETKNILLATGSEAKFFPGMEPDGKGILTNREVLALRTQPKSMVVIGAGAVGIEFASCFNSFGTKVTVVEMLPQVVPLEDEEVARELEKILTKRGIKFRTGTKTESIKRAKDGYDVTLGGATSETVNVEAVVVAVGRRPMTEGIGIENTRAKVERGFVKVDRFMQTDEPGVYAIGDIVPTPMLAHVASAEGILAVERIAGKPVEPIHYDRIPSVTYCDPQVGSVGLTEKKAKERGHEVKTGKFPFVGIGKASVEGENDGFVKIVADAKYGEILGVHILHARAGELIPEAMALMNGEMTVEALVHAVHPHPTLSEAIGEAAHAYFGHAIHI